MPKPQVGGAGKISTHRPKQHTVYPVNMSGGAKFRHMLLQLYHGIKARVVTPAILMVFRRDRAGGEGTVKGWCGDSGRPTRPKDHTAVAEKSLGQISGQVKGRHHWALERGT